MNELHRLCFPYGKEQQDSSKYLLLRSIGKTQFMCLEKREDEQILFR